MNVVTYVVAIAAIALGALSLLAMAADLRRRGRERRRAREIVGAAFAQLLVALNPGRSVGRPLPDVDRVRRTFIEQIGPVPVRIYTADREVEQAVLIGLQLLAGLDSPKDRPLSG